MYNVQTIKLQTSVRLLHRIKSRVNHQGKTRMACGRSGQSVHACSWESLNSSTSYLAPVVQTLDSAIHWIIHYPLDNSIRFASVYPLDSDLSGGQRYPSFEQLG